MPAQIRRPGAALAALALSLGLAVTTPGAPAEAAKKPTTANQIVDRLVVKGKAPKTGYDRAAFGWNRIDLDRNGCVTRDDVLRRDLVSEKRSNRCHPTSGVLRDRYSRTSITITNTSKIDVDHIVSLSNAWQTGAGKWSTAKRRTFGNDPLNLVATTPTLNRQKGDGDAATWLPPAKAGRCEFVARQATVKYRYGLWVTSAEKAAMKRILANCPRTPIPTATQTPAAYPKPKPAPKPKPTPGTDPRFGTCTEAKRHGYGPYRRGVDPEYAWYIDRDGDGVVCE